jgi:hypothetical protein
MSTEFDLVHNHHERSVFAAVLALAPSHPKITSAMLADIACVALNRLPARYIRHEVDFAFYLSDQERAETQAAVDEAVNSAFAFVLTRAAANAR